MTLNLPLLYVLWLEEYCWICPNKNRSPNLWHVTSILVYFIIALWADYLLLSRGVSSNGIQWTSCPRSTTFLYFFFKSSMYLACILYASYLLDFTDFEQPGIFENRWLLSWTMPKPRKVPCTNQWFCLPMQAWVSR